MKTSPDPSVHRQAEQRFIEHVERLLDDDRLRLDTARGRKPITLFIRRSTRSDRAVDLKRVMVEMGKPDRDLQSRMPVGETVEVELTQKRLWVLRKLVGRLKAVCVSPTRVLLNNLNPQPMTRGAVEMVLDQAGTKSGAPTTVVVLSTCGFASDAYALAQRTADRTVILVEPNDAGGFAVHGPADAAALNELFDPEAEDQKRQRIRDTIASTDALELSGSGIAADRIAAKTQLPAQMVEAELKSYARLTPGLAAKKLDGRLVLFREGSVVANNATATAGGISMPMIDKIKALFARKGETEKKIAFLSERRAALGQQRDRAYEEIASLETKDAELKDQFKNAGADLIKRRITSQLLQLRKDMERRQQLLGVLNQQVNVVSTHLHNLELVQQGQTAKLPDSEEMASDAAAAEEMLAELQESSEMAESVGGVASTGLSAEEQALYEELQAETGAMKSSATAAEPTPQKSTIRPVTESKAPASPTAAKPEPRRADPEAG